MNQKKELIKFLLAIVVTLIVSIIINYKIDAYGIFRNSYENQILEPNQNYIKTKYILKNKNKYNSFAFGSSRIGKFPTEKIENGRYYNMTYSGGLPEEWLNSLKILLKRNVKIDNLLLGLDDISFSEEPETRLNSPMRCPYNTLSEDKIKFVKLYLLKNPLSRYNFITLKNKIFPKKYKSIFDIKKTGRFLIPSKDKEIEKNINRHIKGQQFNSKLSGNFFNQTQEIKTLETLREIKLICNKNGINLIMIFNPLYKTAYYLKENDKFEKIKLEVSKINKVYDFALLNEISENNYYWYEKSHYRPVYGEKMREVIFEGNKNVPKNFYRILKDGKIIDNSK